MKTSQVMTLLVTLVTVIAGESAAQQPQPRGPGITVAILDLTYVYKNHLRFQQMSNDMRREVDAAENALKSDRESYRKLAEQLDTTYRKGTPDYKAMEEELAKKAADLNLQVNIQKKNFLEQEAKIYYNVYQEVLEHVKYYCEANGVTLVLRFNGDPIDRNDPQDVLKELNKSVIYYHQAIDITPVILERINSAAQRGVTGPAAPSTVPQQAMPTPPGLPPRR